MLYNTILSPSVVSEYSLQQVTATMEEMTLRILNCIFIYLFINRVFNDVSITAYYVMMHKKMIND
jgi:hypothetical protein